jgi:acyl-CoA synthetase (AMP-forming)/AMP-acid ligase II
LTPQRTEKIQLPGAAEIEHQGAVDHPRVRRASVPVTESPGSATHLSPRRRNNQGVTSTQGAGRPVGAEARLRARAADLGVERVRSRTSAYVYGNVLVLAAVVQNNESTIESGRAVIIVLVTMVTTYLAHVLAHDVAERIGRSTTEHEVHLRAEFRDALPIVSSGVPPALVLGCGALGWLETEWAQILAAIIVIVRLGATGWVIRRISAQHAARRSLWSGVVLAFAGLVIAILKVEFLH